MAYAPTTNPLVMIGIYRGDSSENVTTTTTGSGRARFQYNSADSSSTVRGAGYFAGAALNLEGIEIGCVVEATVNAGGGYLNTVSAIDADTGDVTVVAFTYG